MAQQPTLNDMECFINGVTTLNPKNTSNLSYLVHCGLSLLRKLPASKDVVFEYFNIFLDVSTAGYVKLIEVSFT